MVSRHPGRFRRNALYGAIAETAARRERCSGVMRQWRVRYQRRRGTLCGRVVVRCIRRAWRAYRTADEQESRKQGRRQNPRRPAAGSRKIVVNRCNAIATPPARGIRPSPRAQFPYSSCGILPGGTHVKVLTSATRMEQQSALDFQTRLRDMTRDCPDSTSD